MKVSFQRFGLASIYDHDWRSYLAMDTIPAELLVFGQLLFLSDAFLAPEQGIFGIVRSFYSWSDLSFLAHYNVQFAMTTLRESLQNPNLTESKDTISLPQLIEKVYHAFQNMDVRSHLVDAQRLMNLPNLGEAYRDVNIIPNVMVTLAQLQEQHLSLASLGGVAINVAGVTGYQEIVSYRGINSSSFDWGHFLYSGEALPPIETHELIVEPGDLVVAATFSLGEVIRKAQFKPFIGVNTCDTESVNQYLLATLKTLLDGVDSNASDTSLGGFIERMVASFGGTWVIACPV
jgi:hypothetical protein